MPGRGLEFRVGGYYHVFNRGVAKQVLFAGTSDYKHALFALNYYRFIGLPLRLSKFNLLTSQNRQDLLRKISTSSQRWVSIVCFALMPNHIHLVLKQEVDGGVSNFMSKFSNSYSKYFNSKNHRVGPIFQGTFKVVEVSGEEQLLHLSRYIHINPVVVNLVAKQQLTSYPWTSLPYYRDNRFRVVDPEMVMSRFKSFEAYKEFLDSRVDYGKQLENIKHLVIEE